VHKQANAPLVKQTVEELFEVKVRDVAIINRAGKKRRSGKTRKFITSPDVKKAIVSLAEGYTLDLFSQGTAESLPNERSASEHKQEK
jgi:large subunit ribosomal protein L23